MRTAAENLYKIQDDEQDFARYTQEGRHQRARSVAAGMKERRYVYRAHLSLLDKFAPIVRNNAGPQTWEEDIAFKVQKTNEIERSQGSRG